MTARAATASVGLPAPTAPKSGGGSSQFANSFLAAATSVGVTVRTPSNKGLSHETNRYLLDRRGGVHDGARVDVGPGARRGPHRRHVPPARSVPHPRHPRRHGRG